MRGLLGPALLARTKAIKAVLYVLIIIVTTYYSLFGRSLDLIDSILWLLAFLFIEINITHWNEEDSMGLPTTNAPAR